MIKTDLNCSFKIDLTVTMIVIAEQQQNGEKNVKKRETNKPTHRNEMKRAPIGCAHTFIKSKNMLKKNRNKAATTKSDSESVLRIHF